MLFGELAEVERRWGGPRRTLSIVVGVQHNADVFEEADGGEGPDDQGERPHGILPRGRMVEHGGEDVQGGGRHVPKDHANTGVKIQRLW